MRGRKAGHGKGLIFGFKYFLNQRFVFQDFDLSPLAKSWSGWQSQSDRASREVGGAGREDEKGKEGAEGAGGRPGEREEGRLRLDFLLLLTPTSEPYRKAFRWLCLRLLMGEGLLHLCKTAAVTVSVR